MGTPHLPTLKQLEAFLAIEATRNLTAAAAKLNVSQPALSRTLHLMEEALNHTLFKRSTRSMELSNAGTRFLPIAKRLVGEFRRAFSEFDSDFATAGERVVIAGLTSAVKALVPPAIQQCVRNNPNVEIVLTGAIEHQVLRAVRSGEADFGIVTKPVPADWFVFTEILQDEFVVICSTQDPLARKASLSWKGLEGRPFISAPRMSSVGPLTDSVFIELGIHIGTRYECDSIALIGALVEAGLGVSVVPRVALDWFDEKRIKALRLVNPTLRRSLGLIRRSDSPLSPMAALLHDTLAASKPLAGSKRR